MSNTDLRVKGIFRSSGEAETANAFGIGVDFLLRADETMDLLSVYRLTVQPGDGSPPHVHRNDDETFYVLTGDFEYRCGTETIQAGPGSIMFLPRAVPHQFRNIGKSVGQLLAIGTPAGHERFFADAARLSSTPSPEEAIAVCQRHGMEIVNF